MSRHLVWHLIVPLIVGLGVEIFFVYIYGNFHEWSEFVKEKSSLIIGVIATYVAISAFFIHRETSNQIERSQLDDLTESLTSAKSFFATNTLSLKEWFEPSTQIYFARIVKQQMDTGFQHVRVVLLFTDGEIKNYRTGYIDEHYVKALIEIHKIYDIDLAVLERRDIDDILSGMSFEEKKLLNLFPFWIQDWSPKFIQNGYLKTRWRIPELDFAFITHANEAGATVFPFSKRGRSKRICSWEEKNQKRVEAYATLMSEIKKTIYNGDEIRSHYIFAKKVEVI